MKRASYKAGGIVALIDGVHYKYLGRNRKLRSYLHEPIEPQVISISCTLTDEERGECKLNEGTVPFAWKMHVNIKTIKKA